MGEATQTIGPDLESGVQESDLSDGVMLVGHVGQEAVLLARRREEIFAIGATCTHYGGPLGEGLMVGDTVRCPWHHACFSLRTGEALTAPAFAATSCWPVERRDGRIFVGERTTPPAHRALAPQVNAGTPQHMLVIGGGAAGFAAAEMLRREGYEGKLTIVSADESPPYDRPSLSKDYLAGAAPEEWIPLRPSEFYVENAIELRLRARVTSIDPSSHRATLSDGEEIAYTKLLVATGAEPITLQAPGFDLPHVCTLRSLADSRAIKTLAKPGGRALIVGASFIGLEAAAALRRRDVAVDVVAPEARPMERVFGPMLGDFVRGLHEAHGVVFHLGHTVAEIGDRRVRTR